MNDRIPSSRSGPELREEFGLLTDGEFCDMLGIKVVTAANWRSLGTGPPFLRLAGRAFYRVDDVRDWINRGGGSLTSARFGNPLEHASRRRTGAK